MGLGLDTVLMIDTLMVPSSRSRGRSKREAWRGKVCDTRSSGAVLLASRPVDLLKRPKVLWDLEKSASGGLCLVTCSRERCH